MKMRVLDVERTENYIKVRFDRSGYTEYKMWNQVMLWCEKTDCGKRVNYNSFAFKTEAEYMMFSLRWI